jgi:hypothetical protein
MQGRWTSNAIHFKAAVLAEHAVTVHLSLEQPETTLQQLRKDIREPECYRLLLRVISDRGQQLMIIISIMITITVATLHIAVA